LSTSDDDPTAATIEAEKKQERAPREPAASSPRSGRLAPGRTLGRYRILGPLGRGGMGEVHRAHDPELGRDVAIKLLSRRADDAELGGSSRLWREAQALARLSHPNVVTVFEVGTADNLVFLATELVEGETLSHWLRNEPRTWRDVRDVFLQAGRGLAAAHAAGLVHRDFKPANVIVGSDGRVRVLDFGLARASASFVATEEHEPSDRSQPQPRLAPAPPDDAPDAGAEHHRDPDSGNGQFSDEVVHEPSDAPSSSSHPSGRLLESPLTSVDVVVGTPPYMAPEQLEQRACDARTDQFSFCVSLYAGLYGDRPFAGIRYDDLKANVLAGRVRAAPAHADVPRWLRRVVVRGLAVDPAERWPSMDALLAAMVRDPMERWRRVALLGAVVAALAVGALGWWQGRHGVAARPCADAGAPMARVWNRGQRAGLEQVFRATGHPHAGEAFASAAGAIDQRAAAWIGMRTEACEATSIRREQSADLLDLRMECLEQRRIDLEAHVELLRQADRALVQRIYESPPPGARLDECADVETLHGAERLPEGAAARARFDELRTQLGRARALQDAGRYREVVPLADQIIAGALALHHRTLGAEAGWLRGRTLEYIGDYPAARAALGDSARAALAARRDDLAATAWTDLAWTLGLRENRLDEAHEWARYAEAALERLPGRAELRAELWRVEGVLYFRERRWSEAKTMALRSLELYRRVGPEQVGTVLTDLGDIAGEQGLFNEAYDYYRQAQEAQEARLGREHPLLIGLYNNLGIALSHLGRPLEAKAAYERSLTIAQSSLGPTHPTVGHTLNNLALLDVALGRPLDSLPLYDQAISVYKASEGTQPYIAITDVNRADALTAAGRPGEALADAEAGLALLGTDADTAVYRSAAQQSAAAALVRLGRAAEALPRVRAACRGLAEQLGPVSPYVAGCLLLEGQTLAALGRPLEALAPLSRALTLRTTTPLDRSSMAEVQFALAQVLLLALPAQREHALRLARAAVEGYRATAATLEPRAAEAEAWLDATAAR
jgi:serine/threonine protein kinase/tetratricopeptide (TPR) repeat protein